MCAHKHFTAAASRGNITKWLIKALFLLLFPVVDAQFCALLHSVASVPSADDTTGGQFPPRTLCAAAHPHLVETRSMVCKRPTLKGNMLALSSGDLGK